MQLITFPRPPDRPKISWHPFPRPESGRIAVEVINHLGDKVMRVFRVG